jgi:hypothetical protein
MNGAMCRVRLALKRGPKLKQRRAFPRWPVTVLGHCCGRFDRSSCLITDLNEAGLKFVSDQSPEIGDTVEMEWPLDPLAPSPLRIMCRVTYVSNRRAGVEFLNLRLSDRLRILEFVTQKKPIAKAAAASAG